MINEEIKKLKSILDAILGESKQELDDSMQLEYPCPRCIEKYGNGEINKHNLSISLSKNLFQCWKCSSEEDEMHGSILKLIRLYGNEELLNQYKSILMSIRESKLYQFNISDRDLDIDTSIIDKEELRLPSSYKIFKKEEKYNRGAFAYLNNRGINWDIIEKYSIGFTEREEEHKMHSYRVIIPSYDSMGVLNYWVGRDYLPKNDKFSRIKYVNPNVNKKDIIFNEGKVQWDADITLVEGPFDHIVVPNSIPLLGKHLDQGFRLYYELINRANSLINVWIDGDAIESAKEVYSLLNHGRLYGKIRLIPTNEDDDPSSLFQKGGNKLIGRHLANAIKINEAYLP